MSAGTVKTFVERVLERHGEDFDTFFPARVRLARARRGRAVDGPPAGRRDRWRRRARSATRAISRPSCDLVEASEQVFVNAYLGGLAGIAWRSTTNATPSRSWTGSLRPLEDAEEERFEALRVRVARHGREGARRPGRHARRRLGRGRRAPPGRHRVAERRGGAGAPDAVRPRPRPGACRTRCARCSRDSRASPRSWRPSAGSARVVRRRLRGDGAHRRRRRRRARTREGAPR